MHHPAVEREIEKRASDFQVKIASGITSFAGSMMFVYVHIVIFAFWMLVLEKNPWPMLTLVVSLEAIFLSTFVMIGQNRQASFQQAKADHDFVAQEQELSMNTELTKKIHELTIELHAKMCLGQDTPPADASTTAG
ncbi:DUF1003 domain-containing protein [Acidothermaceae bacterium B102]|nr:DUF1003 domain-containing protein [Acidothermaceae bacterium B102]